MSSGPSINASCESVIILLSISISVTVVFGLIFFPKTEIPTIIFGFSFCNVSIIRLVDPVDL